MSRHRDAFEAYRKLLEYTDRHCKNCIFAIKGFSSKTLRVDDVFCALDGCPHATTSSVLADSVFKRVAELEKEEANANVECAANGGN